MKHPGLKETEDAPETSTCRTSRSHRCAGGENRGRGQGRHTRPRAGRENRSRGRGRHTRTAGSPPPNLVPDWSSEDADTRAGQGAGNPPLAPRSPCVDAKQPRGNAMSRRAGATPPATARRRCDRDRDRRRRARGKRRNDIPARHPGCRDRADGDRPSARWLRGRRQIGPALASLSATGDHRDRARDDTDPDGGPPGFPLDVARKRMGAHRRTVLVSDALLMRRRLLAHPDDPAGSSSEVAS